MFDDRGPEHRDLHRRWGKGRLHSSRKLSSEDLQLILLSLLGAEPRHGYELIKSLEELSRGFYVPSPGMIYPSLIYLQEVGLAEVEMDGNKKRYSLTAEGVQHLAKRDNRAKQILRELEQIGARMEGASKVLRGEADADEQVAGQGEALWQTRHRLRDVVRGYVPEDEEDETRVIQILNRTIARIQKTDVLPDPDALEGAIARRRSLGLARYRPDPIDPILIERVLAAANWAPSHHDTEPWRFTVFTGDGRTRLGELFALSMSESPSPEESEGGRKRAFAAPAWISIGVEPNAEANAEEEVMAVACAVQNLHLMACELGLVGMWHSKGPSVQPRVAAGLSLEPPARLLGFFMLGWPACEVPKGERGDYRSKVTWIREA